jgi:hypothetical protein
MRFNTATAVDNFAFGAGIKSLLTPFVFFIPFAFNGLPYLIRNHVRIYRRNLHSSRNRG